MHDIYTLVVKGLADAGIVTADSTGNDLRAILPDEVVEKIDRLAKQSAGSAYPIKEMQMGSAPELEGFDLPDEIADYISNLEATVVKLSNGADDDDDELREEMVAKVLNSMDPAVAEIIKADRMRLAEAEQALAAERSEKIRKAYEAKAATFGHIDDAGEGLAEILYKVASYDPEVAQNLEALLGRVEKVLATSSLFDERGHEIPDLGSDALEKATVIAKSLVDSGEAASIEAARAMVWEANPGLYQQYQEERDL